MSESPAEYSRPPDWGPGLDYWVPDGETEPDIPWPENVEVCGVPEHEPFVLGGKPKRDGTRMMVWPMFDVADPLRAIEVFCEVLERMEPPALKKWYGLQDRFLHLAAGDVDMDASNVDCAGFTIPADLIKRIRRLKIRLQVTLHPSSDVKLSGWF